MIWRAPLICGCSREDWRAQKSASLETVARRPEYSGLMLDWRKSILTEYCRIHSPHIVHKAVHQGPGFSFKGQMKRFFREFD